MLSEPRIFLSAGETSGDLHGAALAQELHRTRPSAELLGLAGPRMAEAGVTPIVQFDRLVVMGFAEVLARLPFFLATRGRVRGVLDAQRPDIVIAIDYPGFNLWLIREAKARGIRVLYYIAPQIWAWRPSRGRILARNADRVAVAFPHEELFLREFGVETVFVGHPLLDLEAGWEGREAAISALNLDGERPVLGLLPGSRPQEVRRLLKPFLQVAGAVTAGRPDVQVLVSTAPEVGDALYDDVTRYRLVDDSHRVMSAATAVLTKSGTSTVEAALIGTPMVIAHKMHPLTYSLARRLVNVDSIGMVNILAGERIVPEYVQRLPRDEIAARLISLLDAESTERQRMVTALEGVRSRLGTPGAAKRVARETLELLDAGS